jgi:hypothetical protein
VQARDDRVLVRAAPSSPGFRVILPLRLPSTIPWGSTSGNLGSVRRRLQWRVRGGFSPPSVEGPRQSYRREEVDVKGTRVQDSEHAY